MPRAFLPTLLLLAAAGPLSAQGRLPADSPADPALPAFAGPAAPLAPEVFAQDEAGRVTLRATRLATPLTLDGALDEAAYRDVKPITQFIQMEPRQGQPATERTAVWLFFDDRNFYVAVRSYDSAPERLVANELRRDNFNIFQNDNLTVSIDPLYTRRSGYFFQTNPLGALRDQEVFDERSNNNDWNTVWYTRSRILADGWTTEIAIPFRSLRFRAAGPQVWGFNLRRVVRWKNEQHSIAPIPASAGNRAMYRFDIFATLVGVETPSRARNLEVKPYAIGSVTTNRAARPPFTNDPSADLGGDVKYGLTRSLVADLTVRTDFAQVEEDQQQVNLTRFSLFFPERRDFFLEGQGLFNFGAGQRGGGGGGFGPSVTPVVFYSRRIGLSGSGQSVPIEAGGRVSGRIGKYSLGLLNIQTDDSSTANASATNFSVVRLRRDVLRRSNVGLIATHRAPADGPANSVFGVDANLAFFQNVIAQGFWTVSHTDRGAGSVAARSSYRGEFEYNGDRYGARIERLTVGERYDPQVGFLRREAFSRNYGTLRFSPRPRQNARIRKHYYEAEFDHIAGSDGVLETQEARATYRLELQNNDEWRAEYVRAYELLRQAFPVAGRVVPAGGYRFADLRSEYQFGPQRRLSGTVALAHGGFYDGTKTEAGYRGLVVVSPRLTLEPGIAINWLDLPAGRATTKLVTNRTNLTLSPRMALAVNVQYNSTGNSVISSIRYRWEYRAGSDLFVVYSDGRDTTGRRGFPDLVNRTFVVKATRLWRF